MTTPRMVCSALAALVALGAVASRAEAADITVAPGGSINEAVNRARPGDRVLVRAGVYPGSGWIGPVHGTAAAPITVLSVDGPRRAVLEGSGESLRIGDGSSYLIFDGFEVRNSGDNAVHIDGGAHHITLRNLYAHDAGFNGDVVKVNQAHDITIERSELARPGLRAPGSGNPSQECIDFVDVDNAILRDNYIHDSASMLGYVKGGSRNAIIERNVFSEQRAGASDPAFGLGAVTAAYLLDGEQYEAINVVFRNNVILNGTEGALAIYDVDGAYVANNLFLNNDRVVVEFRAGSGPAGGSRDVQVVNNLVVDTRGRMPVPYLRSSHTLTGFATSHNLFWNNGVAVPSTSLLVLASQPGHLVANPLLGGVPAATAARDAAIAMLRPGAGSPAAGSGRDSAAAPFGVVDDITGTARASRLDRGPYALTSPTPPPVMDAGAPMRDASAPPPVRDAMVVADASASPRDVASAPDAAAPEGDAGGAMRDASRASDSALPSGDSGARRDASATTDGGDTEAPPRGCAAGCTVASRRGGGGLGAFAACIALAGALAWRARRRRGATA